MYFFYQTKGGEEKWSEALASQRDSVIKTKAPRYSTILDLDLLIDEDTTQEQFNGIRYFGDMYFDFDSDDIEDCLVRVNKFIKKLEEAEVDLDQLSFYATGKKGFHCTIPQECFVVKPNPKGVVGLPHIYKEMAFAFYVDTLDLKVYSARKGRMFRTVNVERENGRYKVQVTAQELKDMTEEIYVELTSAPRALIPTTTPTLNDKLSIIYSKAEQKIIAAAKRRGSSQKENEQLQKFKGEFPDTIKTMMSGEGIVDGSGFNKIAMQLGIVANGLKKGKEEYLAACAGLIKNHTSDGARYNSEKKREAELLRMYEYTQDNVCYAYSVGAIKSMLKPEHKAEDLQGFTGAIISEVDEDTDESLYGGVVLTTEGVLRKTEEGFVQICDLGFKNVKMLRDMEYSTINAYEVDVDFRKTTTGRKTVALDTFMSKSKFQAFSMANSGAFTGSEAHVSPLYARLRDMAIKTDGVVNLLHKEGLDVIKRNTPDGPVTDLVWVGVEKVTIAIDPLTGEKKDINYRFSPRVGTRGVYKSDLLEVPSLEGSEAEVKALLAFLDMNEPKVIGNLFGWAVSCFHRTFYQQLYKQFPIAQVFGQAGCGKSTTVGELLQLFYYLVEPKVFSASKNTKAMIDSFMQSSASIPLALDEYKPREMRPEKAAEVRFLIREAYNCRSFGKLGAGDGGINSNMRDAQEFTYSAPIIFMGEGLEAETAILERTVSVMLTKQGLDGRDKNIKSVRANRKILSSLGKRLVYATFATNIETFRDTFDTIEEGVKERAFNMHNERVVFNIAVVLNGLEFAKKVLGTQYEGKLNEKLDQLIAAVSDISNHIGTVIMSEAAKVLNMLSYITRTEHQETEFGFKHNIDYHLTNKHVDIRMRNAFIKYAGWSRRKGREVLYDNEEAFMQGLGASAACVDQLCIDSPLYDSSLSRIYRFSLLKLETEMVEAFK